MQPNGQTHTANEHIMVKTPGWKEVYQLAICNSSRGVETASPKKQIQLSGPSGQKPGTSGFQVQRARPNYSATLPLVSKNELQASSRQSTRYLYRVTKRFDTQKALQNLKPFRAILLSVARLLSYKTFKANKTLCV